MSSVQSKVFKRSISGLSTLAMLGMISMLGMLGCASFKLKDPPPGFIEVSSSDWDHEAELRMKAPDDVGLNITSFPNRRGGTLPLWANDMVKKLAARGYTLEKQTAVESANGVTGTRFDFSYTPLGVAEIEGETTEKFYTAVLFVTDDWKVVVQLAGDKALEAEHDGDLERILSEIKIRGCDAGSKVCKAEQPTHLSAPMVEATKASGPGPEVQPEPEPESEEPKPNKVEPAESPADDGPAADG